MPNLNTYNKLYFKFSTIKLVSWDIDGTLYSIGRMKWQLLRILVWEIASGRGRAAYRDLAALRHYKVKVDAARLTGGALDEDFQKENFREALLNVERRWYGQAIRQI